MNLTIQLGSAALLVLVATLAHGAGVVGIARLLALDAPAPGQRRPFRTAIVLSEVALLLFALHMAEVALFAAFYLLVGALPSLEEAIFFSASAYSTLSQPPEGFPLQWRLVGAIEGLAGFLLIGWSTAFFVTDMNRLLRPGSGEG